MSGPATERKLILVTRPTRLQELVMRYNTVQQARFYIERLGADFGDYEAEDRQYQEVLAQVTGELEAIGRLQVIDRAFLPSFIFGPQDTVVVLGQDGLVANTLKYLDGQPLVGVNPDPLRWDGVLLPFQAGDLRLIMRDVLRGQRPYKAVTLAQAELSDGQTLHAVNDLFIGRKSHVSARYELALDGRTERQSSSGIIVSTGLGSTGWFKSVLAGAAGIVRGTTGQPLAIEPGMLYAAGEDGDPRAAWDAPELYFAVREPFPSRTTTAELVFGRIGAGRPLRIVSQMPEDGVIFSDGVESDFLVFQAGVEATISIADQMGCLVI
ncbi:sugar kinase [Paenibacillus sp. 1P07SE]|uniref:sugar kinase n=1 Tax=Paenibacillus sp. 1P07SE TaxID=3132209 RepID=UPI0039A5478A